MMFIHDKGVLMEEINNGAGPSVVWVEDGKVGDKLTKAKLEKALEEGKKHEKKR